MYRSLLRTWSAVAVLGLQWDWRFGRSGLLPGTPGCIALADESSSETVVTWKDQSTVIPRRLERFQGGV